MQFKHTHLWNDLPYDERCRLMPYMVETHILHLEQMKIDIERHHRKQINAINGHIRNLKQSLSKLEGESEQAA